MAGTFGGIRRSGTSGSYSYSTVVGRKNNPVNYVSFWDAARFMNWLTTGNTETGVYMLTAGGIYNNTITRDATAWANGGVAIASEDEWYKAVYYSGSPTGADGDGYWLYPNQSNSITTADANYLNINVTPVGAYANDASYYGTFDQGGNVWEWNDEILLTGMFTSIRVLRGGSFSGFDSNLQSSGRIHFDPTVERGGVGFRVSSLEPTIVPEPSTYAAIFGGLGLLIVLLRRNVRSTL